MKVVWDFLCKPPFFSSGTPMTMETSIAKLRQDLCKICAVSSEWRGYADAEAWHATSCSRGDVGPNWASFFFGRSWNLDRRELHDMLRRLIMCVLQCSLGSARSSRMHLLTFWRRQDCVGWKPLASPCAVKKNCVGARVDIFWYVHLRRLPSTQRRPAYTQGMCPNLVYRTQAPQKSTGQLANWLLVVAKCGKWMDWTILINNIYVVVTC